VLEVSRGLDHSRITITADLNSPRLGWGSAAVADGRKTLIPQIGRSP
jgi:hypothetical protein